MTTNALRMATATKSAIGQMRDVMFYMTNLFSSFSPLVGLPDRKAMRLIPAGQWRKGADFLSGESDMNCDLCGKSLDGKNKQARFCSDKCEQKSWRERNPEKQKSYYTQACLERSKAYSKSPQGKIRDANKRGRPGYASKAKAHMAIYNALRDGIIIRPSECSRCDKPNKQIEGHHYKGYDFPLDVMWLCPSCHKETHKTYKLE